METLSTFIIIILIQISFTIQITDNKLQPLIQTMVKVPNLSKLRQEKYIQKRKQVSNKCYELNSILSQFSVGEELKPQHFLNRIKEETCLGCIQKLEKGQKFQISKESKRFSLFIPDIKFVEYRKINNKENEKVYQLKEESSDKILKSLCSLMNQRKGYMFIGISDNMKVDGIKMTLDMKDSFVSEIKFLLSKFIVPVQSFKSILQDSGQFDKAFQITFIPVAQKSNLGENSDNLFGIRIKVDLTRCPINLGKLFFVYHQENKQSQAFFMKDEKIEKAEPIRLYQQIAKKSRQISLPCPNILSHDENISCKTTKSQHYKAENWKNQYENSYEYIVVISNKDPFRSKFYEFKKNYSSSAEFIPLQIKKPNAKRKKIFYYIKCKSQQVYSSFKKQYHREMRKDMMRITEVKLKLSLKDPALIQSAITVLKKKQEMKEYLFGQKNQKKQGMKYFVKFNDKFSSVYGFCYLEQANIPALYTDQYKEIQMVSFK